MFSALHCLFFSYPHQLLRAYAGPGGLRGKLLNDTIFTGQDHPGLRAFFGTVECQGRGSLHLHMLIWLAGFPSPAELMRRINEFLKEFPLYNHDPPDPANSPSSTPTHQPETYVPTEIDHTDFPGQTIDNIDLAQPPANATDDSDINKTDLSGHHIDDDMDVEGAEHTQSSSDDPPDSPWLQPTWLKQVARYLESIIQQDYPRFTIDDAALERVPAFLSKQPTYFDTDTSDEERLHEFPTSRISVFHTSAGRCVSNTDPKHADSTSLDQEF